MNKNHSFAWFMFGLGSQLQIVASLSFTELFVFAAALPLYLKEQPHMRRNGILPFFWVSIFVFIGCVVSIVANHTPFQFALRGLAVTSLLPCTVVVGHWMLRRDMAGFKWMIIGTAISSILCTFIFQQSVEVSMLANGESGADAVEAIMSGPIYWIARLNAVLLSIPKGWYLKCPIIVSAVAPVFMAIFSIFTSASGRSGALTAAASFVLVVLGGKKTTTIRKNICNHFWLLAALGVIGIFCAKLAYQTSAEQGWLGEAARKKYEVQTKGDKSLKALLLGGRMEAFCGLIACVDKPIVGFGPWAEDTGGYVDEFLSKYANIEDYMYYIHFVERLQKNGITQRHMIPAHAYITEFWLWYGIAGLVFWLYVIYILLRYLRQDCWAVPHWYMWLAASIPAYFWGIFFSPWSARVHGALFVVACLMARAVRKGAFVLPQAMLDEVAALERK